jgi:hypothetical protein
MSLMWFSMYGLCQGAASAGGHGCAYMHAAYMQSRHGA